MSNLTGEPAAALLQGLLDWLNEKRLIQSIIELLDPSHDRDTHDNASRLLIEVGFKKICWQPTKLFSKSFFLQAAIF